MLELPRVDKIVCLPGTLCSPAIYRPLRAALQRLDPALQVEVISWLDQPGRKDLPALAELVSTTVRRGQAGRVVLVGHSTGGAIALQSVLTAPELFAGLVLVNSGPNMHEHGDVDAILTSVRDGWGEELREAILRRSFASRLPGPVMGELLEFARSCAREDVLEVLTDQRDRDFTPRLNEISCPVSVVHGVQDQVRTESQARRFAEGFVDGGFTSLGCGHTPPWEAPEELAQVVSSVLQRNRAAGES